VNPSGYRHGIGDSYPKLEFLRAIREAGIETVTVGSDCHSTDRLGENLNEAMRRLREAEYAEVSIFRERKNSRIKLSEILK
jgi:histidinol-phosphatase (PHP family)